MPGTVKDDELLKGACHGLLFGCTLPILAYNIVQKKHRNTLIYLLVLGVEIYQIMTHVQEAKEK